MSPSVDCTLSPSFEDSRAISGFWHCCGATPVANHLDFLITINVSQNGEICQKLGRESACEPPVLILHDTETVVDGFVEVQVLPRYL